MTRQGDLFGESVGGPLGIRSWKHIPIPDLPGTEDGLESLAGLIQSLLVRNQAFRRALELHGIGEDVTGVEGFDMFDELLVLCLGFIKNHILDPSEVENVVEGLRYQDRILEDLRSSILSALDTATARQVMASEPRMRIKEFDLNIRIAEVQMILSERTGKLIEIILSPELLPGIGDTGSHDEMVYEPEISSPTGVQSYITYIRIDGPPGAGKTTLIEHLLRAKPGHTVLVCRMREDGSTTESTVQNEGSEETARYLVAGAGSTAHCDYPPDQVEEMLDWFWDDSPLLYQPSDALVYEFDADYLLSPSLCVFIAPLPPEDRPLVLRGTRKYLELDYEIMLQAMFEDPEAVRLVDPPPKIDPSRPDKPPAWRRKKRFQLSDRALAGIDEMIDRAIASPREKEAWVLLESFGGLAGADAVIINIRNAGEMERAIRFRREIHRIYTEWGLAEDILESRSLYPKAPVFICNLADPDDPILPFALRIFDRILPET